MVVVIDVVVVVVIVVEVIVVVVDISYEVGDCRHRYDHKGEVAHGREHAGGRRRWRTGRGWRYH